MRVLSRIGCERLGANFESLEPIPEARSGQCHLTPTTFLVTPQTPRSILPPLPVASIERHRPWLPSAPPPELSESRPLALAKLRPMPPISPPVARNLSVDLVRMRLHQPQVCPTLLPITTTPTWALLRPVRPIRTRHHGEEVRSIVLPRSCTCPRPLHRWASKGSMEHLLSHNSISIDHRPTMRPPDHQKCIIASPH